MSHALTKIKAAGFVVELDGADLAIEPFSKLTPPQLQFLKTHKAEIVQELESEGTDPCNTPIKPIYTKP